MRIVKKNNTIEEFNHNKVLISIANAADDIGVILNYSDLKVNKNEILNRLDKISEQTESISSVMLSGLIIEILEDLGFMYIANSYLDFKKDI